MPSDINNVTNKQHFLLLIKLRWFAIAGQVVTIFFVSQWLEINLPIVPMALVILFLTALNIVAFVRYKKQKYINKTQIFAELLLDVLSLAIQFYLSGGASNPFITLFLLQIILAAVLLEAWATWIIVIVSSLCFIVLTLIYRPMDIPHHHGSDFFNLHIQGMFICFALASALVVLFVTRIQRNLSERDAQSAEEDHIVRMGLMASGAAHELGTPLATVSVILSDWQRMTIFKKEPELVEELNDMLVQIDRCKTIVSDVLMLSGTARGEGVIRTTLHEFIEGLVAEWRHLHSDHKVDYINLFQRDIPIICDIALKQVIFNILDNAGEVSRGLITVTLLQDHQDIILTISDEGPGFPRQILEEFGKPYFSTKGRPEGGVGLFLAGNVVRKLNGKVSAKNNKHKGATVTIRLPLVSLSDGGEDEQ
ncbi:ATP-binding protein [Brucellaceae bacterium C25G]